MAAVRVSPTEMATRGVGYRELLRRPAFRALWAAGGLTLAVIPVMVVALVWTATQAFGGEPVAERTRSVALALSLLGLSATVPTLGAMLVSGTLADRFPRARLMQAVNAAGLLGVFGVLVTLLTRSSAPVAIPFADHPFPLYLVLLFPFYALVSASATLFRPALNASMPRVVAPSELGTANGLLYAFSLGVGVAGTLAVPVLLVVANVTAALIVPLALLLVAQLFLAQTGPSLDPVDAAPRRRFLVEIADGYRYLAARRPLLQLTLASLAINFLAAVAFVELGLYVTISLGYQAPTYLGALYAGASVGAAVGSLAIARLRFEPRAGRYFAGLVLVQGASVVALSFIRWYPAALADMFLYGLIPGMAAVVFFALVQATVRNDMLGRVFAADEAGSYALVPIGQYVGGIVTLLVGVSTTFLLGGLGILLTGLLMLLSPQLRHLGFSPAGPGGTSAHPDLSVTDLPAAVGTPVK